MQLLKFKGHNGQWWKITGHFGRVFLLVFIGPIVTQGHDVSESSSSSSERESNNEVRQKAKFPLHLCQEILGCSQSQIDALAPWHGIRRDEHNTSHQRSTAAYWHSRQVVSELALVVFSHHWSALNHNFIVASSNHQERTTRNLVNAGRHVNTNIC